MRRVRGKGGIAEDILTGKGPSRLLDFGKKNERIEYVKDAESLKEVLSGLKSKQEYLDYETLRVAERDVALATHRPDIKGTNIKESSAEIKRLELKYGKTGIERLRDISNLTVSLS